MESIRRHKVVGVHETEVFAAGSIDATVACYPRAAVILHRHHPDTAVLGGVASCHVERTVGGDVVHDYKLQVAQGLPQHAFYGGGEVCAGVVDRHYDAYLYQLR